MQSFFIRTTKTLVRLCGCAGLFIFVGRPCQKVRFLTKVRLSSIVNLHLTTDGSDHQSSLYSGQSRYVSSTQYRKDISEDTQETPQSRSTALPRHQTEEDNK